MRRIILSLCLVSSLVSPVLLDVAGSRADSGAALGSRAEESAAVVATGRGFNCWIDGGAARCIGLNSEGQLGDGSLVSRTIAVGVTGLASGVVAIAAGDAHVCALTTGGAVMCWGANDKGQLGDGTTTDSSVPVQVSGLANGVVRIEAGLDTTCAITSGGEALCWGNNQTYGAGSATLDGDADNEFDPILVPTRVTGLANGVVAISVNGERASATVSTTHGCAILQYGELVCWGSNDNGQVGSNAAGPLATPAQVDVGERVTAVSTGALHTCALTESGAVVCWGANGNGQLGTGSTTQVSPGTIHAVAGASANIVQVSTGRYTTCAVDSAGALSCWGDNIHGLIEPTSTRTSVTSPTVPYGLTTGVESVAMGEYSTCALFSMGDLRCWGTNASGQTGDGYQVRSIAPVDVHTAVGDPTPLAGAQSIGSASWSNCAVMASGGLKCWGYNVFGELGIGTVANTPQPVDHATLSSGVQMVEGRAQAMCALLTSTEVHCWGQNAAGQQATGDTTSTLTTRPMLLAAATPVTGVTDLSVGQQHSCVVANAAAYCVGRNTTGALGNGTNTAATYLSAVSGLGSGVSKISVGGTSFTCAVLVDGTARCWGNDGNGQLGNGAASSSTTPVAVSGLTDAVDIVTMEDSACALKNDGTVQCWGRNIFGQLGDGTATTRQTPVSVGGLTGATALAAGPRSVCAIVTNGELRCWGWNFHGIFADGTTTDSNQPVAAQGVNGVTSLTMGSTSICVVGASGAVRCWGSEQSGQVGNNRMENRPYSQHLAVATGLTRSSTLPTLSLLAPTTTTPSTTTTTPPSTVASPAPNDASSEAGATADDLRVDERVYTVGPAKVGKSAMVRIARSTVARKLVVRSATPRTCVAGGRSVVTVRPGDCKVLIRSLRTGRVLRQWRTTVVAEDTGIGSTVRVSATVLFRKNSTATIGRSLSRVISEVRDSRAALVVGHAAMLTGNTPGNRRLSVQRASRVARRIVARSRVDSVEFAGVGVEAPLSRVIRESSQTKNRRVVVYYVP